MKRQIRNEADEVIYLAGEVLRHLGSPFLLDRPAEILADSTLRRGLGLGDALLLLIGRVAVNEFFPRETLDILAQAEGLKINPHQPPDFSVFHENYRSWFRHVGPLASDSFEKVSHRFNCCITGQTRVGLPGEDVFIEPWHSDFAHAYKKTMVHWTNDVLKRMGRANVSIWYPCLSDDPDSLEVQVGGHGNDLADEVSLMLAQRDTRKPRIEMDMEILGKLSLVCEPYRIPLLISGLPQIHRVTCLKGRWDVHRWDEEAVYLRVKIPVQYLCVPT